MRSFRASTPSSVVGRSTPGSLGSGSPRTFGTVELDRSPAAFTATTFTLIIRGGSRTANEKRAGPVMYFDALIRPATTTFTRIVPANTRPVIRPKEISRGAGEVITGRRGAATVTATGTGGASTRSAIGITSSS